MLTMRRANNDKVALVYRPNPSNIKPFCDCDDTCVNKIEASICVQLDKLTRPANVLRLKRL